MEKFEELAMEVAEMLNEKTRQYGTTYEGAGDFLRAIYPNGLSHENYEDAILMIRIYDVLMRRANGGYENAWKYVAGYGILGMDKK